MLPRDVATSVLIVGGGPCGLMLANELGRRGVDALLVDDKLSTAFNPQANATQARTMEHYRRLGFADEVRALGLPPDYPTDIAYFTRFATYELARFSLPSAREARSRVSTLSGSWSTAELPHRVSQKFVEQLLRRHAEALPGISLRYGWRLLAFTDHGTHVTAEVVPIAGGPRATVRAAYLVGADGPRSLVRRQLCFQYVGEAGVVRDFMGGRMYALYVRAPSFYSVVRHAPAWMHFTFNRDRRAFLAAVDGRAEFAFHTHSRRPSARRSRSSCCRASPGRPATRWSPSGSRPGGCSWAATRPTCSRRPAGSATTRRSTTPSISAGSWPPR